MISLSHKVVVVGAGFAGLEAVKRLRKVAVDVTLVDRRNHHLFQPLLYQVATGGLSPADIATPIRGILAKQKNARVLLIDVLGVDVAGRRVLTSEGELPYDTLVVAAGATHSYFGNDAWAEVAPGLKSLEDATDIRGRVLMAFELAESAKGEAERAALLSFVVIGGGPTGVELAGALGELAQHTLKRNFRNFDPRKARVALIEAGPRILGTYAESLSPRAVKALNELGVTVRTGAMVTNVTSNGVKIHVGRAEEYVPARTVIWSAGVNASPLGRVLADATRVALDRTGRVIVEPDLTIRGHSEIFVAGDLAHVLNDGLPLRGTADVAQAEGRYVGDVIAARLRRRTVQPFRFRDFGKLAVIGRSRAVADLKFAKFWGRPAWWFWLFMHLVRLVGYRNRTTVLIQWAWSYATHNKAARLITNNALSKNSGRPVG